MRVLIALGGNAMTGPDGAATQAAQRSAVETAMERVADLVAQGAEVVITHGNGPQVGNLLAKNELAAHVVPAVSLDWCVAQTQATIGLLIVNALERALAGRAIARSVAAVVTRTRVDPDDPGFGRPTKPIGRYLPRDEAARFIAQGQVWRDLGRDGWRRVVASPEPLEILDGPAVLALARSGVIVSAAGGGGIPVVRDSDGSLRGVEAVVDKDLAAALLARTVEADVLVIATDVESVLLDYGTDRARRLGRVSAAELGGYAADGHFASGSMAPKVEALLRFLAAGGRRAAITSLEMIADAVAGTAGTVVDAQPSRPAAGGSVKGG
ncbi:MAG: carbamate kinase [Carbonactinosporaceae bacterium]